MTSTELGKSLLFQELFLIIKDNIVFVVMLILALIED